MQLILFGSLLTILLLFLIHFIYIYCFENFIQYAGDDKGMVTSKPDLLTQANEVLINRFSFPG
jgi:hypothetical protein